MSVTAACAFEWGQAKVEIASERPIKTLKVRAAMLPPRELIQRALRSRPDFTPSALPES